MRKYPVLTVFFSLAGFLAYLPCAFSQSVTTDPAGFTTSSLLGSSDTYVLFPFTQSFGFAGAISSIAGNVITVAGAPGWTSNQFVYAAGTQPNHYYVLIGGDMERPEALRFFLPFVEILDSIHATANPPLL